MQKKWIQILTVAGFLLMGLIHSTPKIFAAGGPFCATGFNITNANGTYTDTGLTVTTPTASGGSTTKTVSEYYNGVYYLYEASAYSGDWQFYLDRTNEGGGTPSATNVDYYWYSTYAGTISPEDATNNTQGAWNINAMGTNPTGTFSSGACSGGGGGGGGGTATTTPQILTTYNASGTLTSTTNLATSTLEMLNNIVSQNFLLQFILIMLVLSLIILIIFLY